MTHEVELPHMRPNRRGADAHEHDDAWGGVTEAAAQALELLEM
ncbi:hypothetical protein [Streptacidiphilus anmyonensis]|nr:hypothetical protein [Streptacidiphilus anmyonensis]